MEKWGKLIEIFEKYDLEPFEIAEYVYAFVEQYGEDGDKDEKLMIELINFQNEYIGSKRKY